jgi:hypothetical protein
MNELIGNKSDMEAKSDLKGLPQVDRNQTVKNGFYSSSQKKHSSSKFAGRNAPDINNNRLMQQVVSNQMRNG